MNTDKEGLGERHGGNELSEGQTANHLCASVFIRDCLISTPEFGVYDSRAEALRFVGLPGGIAANVRQMLYGALLVLVIWWQQKKVRLENPAGQSRSTVEESGR